MNVKSRKPKFTNILNELSHYRKVLHLNNIQWCHKEIKNLYTDKHVARHFNNENHSISDKKVCAMSSTSGGKGSRKRQERRLICKRGTTHTNGLNKRFPLF